MGGYIILLLFIILYYYFHFPFSNFFGSGICNIQVPPVQATLAFFSHVPVSRAAQVSGSEAPESSHQQREPRELYNGNEEQRPEPRR